MQSKQIQFNVQNVAQDFVGYLPMKLNADHTTVEIHREDLALIRYWFDAATDYDKIHQMVEYTIPQEIKNKARRLYGRGLIS
jgi:hypothetical protein